MADKEFVYEIKSTHDATGANQAKQSLDGVNQSAKQSGASLNESAAASEASGSALTAMAAKLGAVTAAFVSLRSAMQFVQSSLAEFARQDMLDAKMEAVLKATGQAAGYTADQLKAMQASLSETTSVSDETIESAQTLLMTFKNIKGDMFVEAQKAVLDMAVIFGSAESAAIQLGKALNDPAAGVAALREIGVSFTEQQQDQIKKLVEQNDLFSAQKIIIEELNSEFGGTAQAVGNSYAGQVSKLANAWSNFKQAIGGTLADTNAVQGSLSGLTTTLRALETAFTPAKPKEYADAIAESLSQAAQSASESFDKIRAASGKAFDEANEKADIQLQKTLELVEYNKRLALAKLELQRTESDMSEADYLQKKAAITGTSLDEEYKARQDALNQRQAALDAEKSRLLEPVIAAGSAAYQYKERVPDRQAIEEVLQGAKDELAGLLAPTAGIITPNMQNHERVQQLQTVIPDLEQQLEAIPTMQRTSRRLDNRAKLLGEDYQGYLTGEYATQSQSIAEDRAALARSQALAGVQQQTQQTTADKAAAKARQEAAAKEQAERAAKQAAERARLEAEDRAKSPEQRTAEIIAQTSTAYPGQKEQADRAISQASARIQSGGDESAIISQLIQTLDRLGASYAGGLLRLRNELDKLDGKINQIESITKVNR